MGIRPTESRCKDPVLWGICQRPIESLNSYCKVYILTRIIVWGLLERVEYWEESVAKLGPRYRGLILFRNFWLRDA